MPRFFIVLLLLIPFTKLHATDTLYFRLSNPWNTVKDINGKYVRKAVITDSGVLGLDYNLKGILVVKGYYTDTNFNRKLYCHNYFNEAEGYREEIRCYENGQLNGIRAGFSAKGDTMWRQTIIANAVVDSKEFPGYVHSKPETFILVEKTAKFPGGTQGWINFLTSKFRYPKEARKQKIEGTVTVQFIVSAEGKVSSVRVVKSVHPIIDEEAVRIIQSSPVWEPATQNGKSVIYRAVQNITFKL